MRNKLILISLLIFSWNSASAKSVADEQTKKITEYKVISQNVADEQGRIFVAIRSFNMDEEKYFLLVNPDTLKTQIKQTKLFSITKNSNQKETKYSALLKANNHPPFDRVGYGIKNFSGKKGVFLTIDMCPSKKKFEKAFYENLVNLAKQKEKPTPIGIAISGMWIIDHAEEFDWILKNKKYLNITWINHSFTHPYNRALPDTDNFMLMPSVTPEREILDTEKLLIVNGQTPSIYFRFPGLMSDEKLIHLLNSYGLVPISTEAWLAKNQLPKDGSIILIHGNSNEPLGVSMMNEILKTRNFELYQIPSLDIAINLIKIR